MLQSISRAITSSRKSSRTIIQRVLRRYFHVLRDNEFNTSRIAQTWQRWNKEDARRLRHYLKRSCGGDWERDGLCSQAEVYQPSLWNLVPLSDSGKSIELGNEGPQRNVSERLVPVSTQVEHKWAWQSLPHQCLCLRFRSAWPTCIEEEQRDSCRP